MLGRIKEFFTRATGDLAIVTVNETVVATLAGVFTDSPGRRIVLVGRVQLTTGVATTGVTLRVRRETLAGALVDEGNPITIGAAAGGTEAFDIGVEDTRDEIAGATYVLTVQQVAATGNGTVLTASLTATVL